MNVTGRLPRPLSTLVGRRQELAALARLTSGHRLLTIVGPGGSGKTRLAVELGHKLQERLENPVLFVDLSSLQVAEMVGSQVAAAAGVPEISGRPPVELLAERLPPGRFLVILDNCEQVAEEAGRVILSLLDLRPDLSVVATSRQPLGVAGEVAWPVPPLGLPNSGWTDPEALAGYDAVRLFVERAGLRRPGYRLTDESGPVVADICRQLDGMPLAIELAAAWVGVLGESEILRRVAGDISLHAPGSEALPHRHRSMASAIEGSCALLGESERRAFARLGVFAGSFDLDAAQAVTGDPDTLVVLSNLVMRSLVTAETDPQRPARFRLLETIRQFAAALLAEEPDSFEVRRRHAAFFLQVAEQAEAVRHTLEASEQVKRLTECRDDFRAALEWTARNAPDRAVELAGALGWYWQTIGADEGAAWLDRALSRRTAEDRFRSRAEDWAGWLAIRRGDFRAAESHIQEGLRISKKIGDKIGVARALTGLGPMSAFMRGDVAEARKLVEEALTLAREAGDPRITGGALTTLGGLAILGKDFERACSLLAEAVEVHKSSGNLTGMGMASVFIGAALLGAGDYPRAYGTLADALDFFESVDDAGDVALVLELMAITGDHLPIDSRVRIAAAGQAVLHRENSTRPPFWDYTTWRDEQRAKLGSRWDRLWEQGTALPLDRAVDIARGAEPRAAEPKGWEKLSRREREVAGLVAGGLSNRQIAERLFISERTAESHVASILTRLGFSSRSQVAAWAAPGP